MQGRRNQVAGPLSGHLDDVFAKIGFNRLDAGGLERRVQVNFLGSHRLAFHHPPCARLLQNVDDDATGVGAVGGVVHVAAATRDACFERLQVLVELGKGLILDRPGLIAQQVGFRHGGKGRAISLAERRAEKCQGRLQRGIGHGLGAGGEELVMFVPGVLAGFSHLLRQPISKQALSE